MRKAKGRAFLPMAGAAAGVRRGAEVSWAGKSLPWAGSAGSGLGKGRRDGRAMLLACEQLQKEISDG